MRYFVHELQEIMSEIPDSKIQEIDLDMAIWTWIEVISSKDKHRKDKFLKNLIKRYNVKYSELLSEANER